MGTSKTENIGISKTEDVDNTKNEDNDKDRDKGRNKSIQMFRFLKRWKDKKGNHKKISGPFGMTITYENYVKSGYIMMVTMHTHDLNSFANVLARCFLLENIRQPHQNITQTLT